MFSFVDLIASCTRDSGRGSANPVPIKKYGLPSYNLDGSFLFSSVVHNLSLVLKDRTVDEYLASCYDSSSVASFGSAVEFAYRNRILIEALSKLANWAGRNAVSAHAAIPYCDPSISGHSASPCATRLHLLPPNSKLSLLDAPVEDGFICHGCSGVIAKYDGRDVMICGLVQESEVLKYAVNISPSYGVHKASFLASMGVFEFLTTDISKMAQDKKLVEWDFQSPFGSFAILPTGVVLASPGPHPARYLGSILSARRRAMGACSLLLLEGDVIDVSPMAALYRFALRYGRFSAPIGIKNPQPSPILKDKQLLNRCFRTKYQVAAQLDSGMEEKIAALCVSPSPISIVNKEVTKCVDECLKGASYIGKFEEDGDEIIKIDNNNNNNNEKDKRQKSVTPSAKVEVPLVLPSVPVKPLPYPSPSKRDDEDDDFLDLDDEEREDYETIETVGGPVLTLTYDDYDDDVAEGYIFGMTASAALKDWDDPKGALASVDPFGLEGLRLVEGALSFPRSRWDNGPSGCVLTSEPAPRSYELLNGKRAPPFSGTFCGGRDDIVKRCSFDDLCVPPIHSPPLFLPTATGSLSPADWATKLNTLWKIPGGQGLHYITKKAMPQYISNLVGIPFTVCCFHGPTALIPRKEGLFEGKFPSSSLKENFRRGFFYTAHEGRYYLCLALGIDDQFVIHALRVLGAHSVSVLCNAVDRCTNLADSYHGAIANENHGVLGRILSHIKACTEALHSGRVAKK